MIIKRHSHDIPQLNTASLPDLIFTVLFFFMIVSHIRTADIMKVNYKKPQGSELTELKKKVPVSYVYIGQTHDKDGKESYGIQYKSQLLDAGSLCQRLKSLM